MKDLDVFGPENPSPSITVFPLSEERLRAKTLLPLFSVRLSKRSDLCSKYRRGRFADCGKRLIILELSNS